MQIFRDKVDQWLTDARRDGGIRDGVKKRSNKLKGLFLA